MFITLPLTQQYFRSFSLKKKMRSFESDTFHLLTLLQQKLAKGQFKNEDLLVLNSVAKLILEKKEFLERERKRQYTVYWLTRQGR
jgi:hypothetical protein